MLPTNCKYECIKINYPRTYILIKRVNSEGKQRDLNKQSLYSTQCAFVCNALFQLIILQISVKGIELLSITLKSTSWIYFIIKIITYSIIIIRLTWSVV